jgi:hypothetical protein
VGWLAQPSVYNDGRMSMSHHFVGGGDEVVGIVGGSAKATSIEVGQSGNNE